MDSRCPGWRATIQASNMNSARYFQRREEYQPRVAHADSPFRCFEVRCLHCESFKLRIIGEFDNQNGQMAAYLFCTSCRSREKLPA
jgi:hypothetical protein